MAILGAAPYRYDAYEKGIAEEYSALPAEVFAAGRRAFLGRLIEGDRLFLSGSFHQLLDGPARNNLQRALTAQRM
jgi:predicted metal-dependent HD superfamily phosphohydrolase